MCPVFTFHCRGTVEKPVFCPVLTRGKLSLPSAQHIHLSGTKPQETLNFEVPATVLSVFQVSSLVSVADCRVPRWVDTRPKLFQWCSLLKLNRPPE